jgi:hydroxypyruvate isomerase
MDHHSLISRRQSLEKLMIGGGALAAQLQTQLFAVDQLAPLTKGIKHSVCHWCYSKKVSLEQMAEAAAGIGLQSIELLNPKDFSTLKKYGLDCAMVSFPELTNNEGKKFGGIAQGFNDLNHHEALIAGYEKEMQLVAEAGFKQIICFSGNRNGMSDAQGLENCAKGLSRLMPLAEKLGVTLCMELLNSRVNHKDYMADHSAWGVQLCKKIGSPHFKLLFDIYHMQIMEGDIIATIKRDHPYFSHYHTGGVPGRAEIDETQELNYPAVVKAIIATGYQGYLGQEFIPKKEDSMNSLKEALKICTV